MPTDRAAFVAGLTDVAPALPAFVPFGIVFGIAAGQAGFAPLEAAAMSTMIFAGTVQFAMIELVQQDALPTVIVLTGLLVGLRYAMYSASLAPYFADLSRRWKWLLAFFLLEMTYALPLARMRREGRAGGRWYYLGVALPLWTLWILTTSVGITVGVRVPAVYDLGFAVPLIFMALLFKTIEDRWTAAAGAVAGVASVAAVGFPFGSGLIAAALVGVIGARLGERVIAG